MNLKTNNVRDPDMAGSRLVKLRLLTGLAVCRLLAQYFPQAEYRLRLPPRHVCALTVAVAFDDCHYNYHHHHHHHHHHPAAD